MLVGREKDYGSPEELDLASIYKDTKWTKSQFIVDMLHITQRSIIYNRGVVILKARLMNLSTIFTFISTLYLLILLFIK